MSVLFQEQETTINFSRDGETAQIYTSDRTMMTRFDKFAERQDCPDWKLVKEIYSQDGELVGKMYETKKQLVSYRSHILEREMTEEQKKAGAERLKAWRESQKEAGGGDADADRPA